MDASKITSVPLLIDTQISNCVQLHIATSNFVKIFEEYYNEVGISYAFKHSESSCDPITKQIEFFTNLNNNTLPFTDQEYLKNAHIKVLTSKIPLQLETGDTYRVDAANNPVLRVNASTGILEALVDSQYSQTEKWVPLEENITKKVELTLSKYSDNIGEANLSDEFLWYWIQKFNTSHRLVKEGIKSLVDYNSSVFAPVGDSVGNILRVCEVVDCNTIPYFDTKLSIFNVIPKPINAQTYDKLCIDDKKHVDELSINTETLFRTCISPVLREISISTVSHGSNLVTDFTHYQKIIQNVDELNGYVLDTLGPLSRILHLIQNNYFVEGSTQNVVLKEIINNFSVNIDILFNKIQASSTKTVTSQLKSQ